MKKSKIELELEGILINIPYNTTDNPDRNGKVYPKEVMIKAIEEYERKILVRERRKKINKIRGEDNLEK